MENFGGRRRYGGGGGYGSGGGGGFGRRRSFGGSSQEKPVKEGETYDVEILEVGSKGDGIAKIQNFVIFVPGTQKGQKVKVRITQVRSSSAVAEVVSEGAGEEKVVLDESSEESEESESEEESEDEPKEESEEKPKEEPEAVEE